MLPQPVSVNAVLDTWHSALILEPRDLVARALISTCPQRSRARVHLEMLSPLARGMFSKTPQLKNPKQRDLQRQRPLFSEMASTDLWVLAKSCTKTSWAGAKSLIYYLVRFTYNARARSDFRLEDYAKRTTTAVRNPFRLHDCFKIAESQFNGAIDLRPSFLKVLTISFSIFG